jgi:hypothetical protein
VLVGVELVPLLRVVEPVAGPGPGHADDVGLGEREVAHGEQLHDLTGEVLVLLPGHVGGVVEVLEHRRVDRHPLDQVVVVPETAGPEELVLGDQLGDVDLVGAAHEVVVEEQHHPLDQRRRCRRHPLDPPLRRDDPALVAGERRIVDGGRTGHRWGSRRVEHPFHRGRPVGSGRERVDLGEGAPEAGAAEEVSGVAARDRHSSCDRPLPLPLEDGERYFNRSASYLARSA